MPVQTPVTVIQGQPMTSGKLLEQRKPYTLCWLFLFLAIDLKIETLVLKFGSSYCLFNCAYMQKTLWQNVFIQTL